MYDNTGMRVRAEPVIAEQVFQRFDELAKSELAPFMFDMKLLNLVGNMNEETLMNAYNEFSLQDLDAEFHDDLLEDISYRAK